MSGQTITRFSGVPSVAEAEEKRRLSIHWNEHFDWEAIEVRAKELKGERLERPPVTHQQPRHKGVCFHASSGKWMVVIRHKGKPVYGGLFSEHSTAVERVANLRESLLQA